LNKNQPKKLAQGGLIKMHKHIILTTLLLIFLLFAFHGTLWGAFRTGLPFDSDWYVDEEIGKIVQGFNQGYFKCRTPYGGYNTITENQKIINSWGYKARPLQEIKHLLPEPQYNMYSDPDVWGTFRISETAWEPVKPRGAMWEKFMAQTERNKKEVYLDENNWLRGYHYGIPFPDPDENDPKIAVKLIWNFYKRYQDNDRVVCLDFSTKERRGVEKHNLALSKRLQFSGRTRDDDVTVKGLYKPNPLNLDFVFASPFVAPYNLRGTICLYYRYNDPDKEDHMWIYIPSIRRVRRMSTAQHQDRIAGGGDFTWDNTEGFEGNVTRFNWVYLGRKEMLLPIISHSHTYYNIDAYLNGMDHYYQRRNAYIIKAVYKDPVNMTEMILFLDPLFFAASYSIDLDLKGREWIVQLITQGRDKHWFYTMYNDYAIDVLRRHSTRAQFAYSGSEDYRMEDLTMDNLMRKYLAR